MAHTSLDVLTRRVRAYFRSRAADFGLRAGRVQARYILNWGGYVNASFTVSDGQTSYHLKLADEEEQFADLQRWQRVSPHLEAKYHAPRLLEWIEIPGTEYAGLLFESIPGRAVDFSTQPEVLDGVLDLLARLHSDQEMAEQLAVSVDAPATCADYFIDVYIDRFDGDLLETIGKLPPFVPLALYDWMMSETRELEGLARDTAAFQLPADSPTHGDLGPNNILVTEEGRWYLIDWDDLSLGDPALEYGIVLGPLWRDGVLTRQQVEALLPGDPALRKRFDLCLRAFVLDQVIDPLADWVEAEFAPEHLEQVRAEKKRIHRTALEYYLTLYR